MDVIARMNIGGPATQLTGLCAQLNHDTFDHRLYTGDVSGDEGDHFLLRESAMPVHRVPGLGRSIKPADDVRAVAHLIKAIRTFRPHIVHTRTTKAGLLGRVAARLSGINPAMAHVFHGHLLYGHFSPPKRFVYVRTERLLASMSDRLVTVGARVRDELLEAGIGRREQYIVTPPGVGLGPIPSREDARRSLGLPPDVPVVAFVGRLTQVKRPDRFVATARAILRQVPDCHFVVCGDGELREQMEQAVTPMRASFHLLGWRNDVATICSAADVVLLTSDNEGMPVALIEAGMAGRPSVSTRVGSVAEVIRHEHTGLVSSADVGELTEHTVRLLTDPELRHRMGEAARDWTTASFGVERLVADTEAMYRSLYEERRARASARRAR
ncbi:glycosyltransferase [Nonomuraea sp. CA-143628]|uniref:glycosyltransferase n=1 Tax=Nonomuraea sp. CA-143628 TaxID=3239997 RepID=UPI003D8AD265